MPLGKHALKRHYNYVGAYSFWACISMFHTHFNKWLSIVMFTRGVVENMFAITDLYILRGPVNASII
jgi:hypothetical protein